MRAATKADQQAVIALWERAGLTRPWNDPITDYDRALTADNAQILVCEDDGKIIGTIMVGEDGHRGWVYYLATAPDHRRAGIGRNLMDAAETWIESRNIPKSQLMVRADNKAAIGFYAALGYEPQDVVTLGKRLIDHE